MRALLRREESYAIRALIDICRQPETTAADVVQRLGMPYAFTAKVLTKLVKAGFIGSQAGRSGGVRSRVDVRQVSMLEVIESMSGDLVLDEGLVADPGPNSPYAPASRVAWMAASRDVQELFAKLTLARLSGDGAGS